MSRIGFLRINESRNSLKEKHLPKGGMYDKPPPEIVVHRPSITILMGEKAHSLAQAVQICSGKYPVNCQWHGNGAVKEYERIESEWALHHRYPSSPWDRYEYLVIRRA